MVITSETREHARHLCCDMTKGCAGAVTHIDEKGYLYCAPHGEQRKASHRCRKVTGAERARLLARLTIERY